MKANLHPELHLITAVCSCGNTFPVHSTKKELRIEICNACHPFFTGKQKLMDTAGRVERFQKRYAPGGTSVVAQAAAAAVASSKNA